MTQLESRETIERIVGATRHATDHLARAVSEQQRVYILHSEVCIASGVDLRHCVFSLALDLGIDLSVWGPLQDETVVVTVDDDYGDLLPARLMS